MNKELYKLLVAGALKSVSNAPNTKESEDGDKLISFMIDSLKETRAKCSELGCGCQKKCIQTIEQELGVKKGTLSEKSKLQIFIRGIQKKIQNFRLKHNLNAKDPALYYNETRN